MSKQTAIEWLFKQLWEEPKDKMVWYAILDKAKEMEKEQIEESFKHGRLPVMLGSFQAKDYYKQTYGK